MSNIASPSTLPLVTIVIPAYNAEKTILRTLETVSNQSYRNLEIVVIDDGSTDKTACLLKGYLSKDCRVSYYCQENQGVSQARNHGIEVSHGNLIMFVDSDDLISHNAVKDMVEALINSRSDFVAAAFQFDKNFADGHVESSLKTYGPSCLFDKESLIRDIVSLYNANVLSSCCNKLYLREVIVKNNITFAHDVSSLEDFIFNLDLLQHCKRFYYLNNVCYRYQLSDEASNSKAYKEDMARQMTHVAHTFDSFCEEMKIEANSPFFELVISRLCVYVVNNYASEFKNIFHKSNVVSGFASDVIVRDVIASRKYTPNSYTKLICYLMHKNLIKVALLFAYVRNVIRAHTGQNI